jgi:hypothetical protein
MKKNILAFCFVSLFFLPAFAHDYAPSARKYYCNAEQIELTDSTIFVHLHGKVFEIDSILTDQGGIYFVEDTLRCVYCRRPLNPKNTCRCPMSGELNRNPS